MATAADVELGNATAPAALLAADADEGAALLVAEGAVSPGVARVWRQPFRAGAAALVALGLLGVAAVVLTRSERLEVRRWPGRAGLQEKQLLSTYVGAAARACGTGPLPTLWGPSAGEAPMELRVLSYNLFWWNLFDKVKPPQQQFHLRTPGNTGTQLLAEAAQEERYDVMGFQECNDEHWLLSKAGLAGSYDIFRDKHCCMAYRTASWTLLDRGVAWVAQDKQYGPRPAQWMRLRHASTGRVLFFVNHHGPIPINSGGVCGGAAVAYNILQLIATKAQPGDAVVLAGDFNSDASSVTIGQLESRLRKASGGVVDGGIDYIFSNLGEGSLVRARNLGNGGSDHDAISAVLRVEGRADTAEVEPDAAAWAGFQADPARALPAAPQDEFQVLPAAPQEDEDGSLASRLQLLVRAPLAWLRK